MTFGLPFDTEMIEIGYVTVQQNGITIIEKPLSACECEGNVLSAKLAQEDTLKLSSSSTAEIRLVVKTTDGERLESFEIIKRVKDTSKEGVI